MISLKNKLSHFGNNSQEFPGFAKRSSSHIEGPSSFKKTPSLPPLLNCEPNNAPDLFKPRSMSFNPKKAKSNSQPNTPMDFLNSQKGFLMPSLEIETFDLSSCYKKSCLASLNGSPRRINRSQNKVKFLDDFDSVSPKANSFKLNKTANHDIMYLNKFCNELLSQQRKLKEKLRNQQFLLDKLGTPTNEKVTTPSIVAQGKFDVTFQADKPRIKHAKKRFPREVFSNPKKR